MDFDFTTKAGWQKFWTAMVTLAVETLAIFGVAQGTLDTIQSLAALMGPIIIMIGMFVANQMAAKGKAAASQKVLETKVDMVKELAVTAPAVAVAVVNSTPSEPTQVIIPTNIPSTTEEVKAWQDKVKVDIDNELAASFHLPTPEAARKAHPELSSLNPSIVWSKSQIRLMDTVTGNISRGNSEAIYATENILLPAAEAALINQMGQDLGNGIKCNWPESYMAKDWVAWCKQHIQGLKTVGDKFDFRGYTVWYAGEVAWLWTKEISPIPWITDFKEGVKKEYWFPNKP
jgi:hypothetical protein